MPGRWHVILLAPLLALSILAGGVTPAAGRQPAATSLPAVLGWSPGTAQDLPPSTPLTIYFTRAMDRLSVQQAWRLSPAVPGSFRWNGTALTWTPRVPLRPASYYRLSLAAGARDATGSPLRPFSLAFSTGDALAVSSFTPAPSTRGVPTNDLIAISFNHPMVALRGLDALPSNPPGWHVAIAPATSGYGSWLGTSTWVFHPDNGLIPSSHYTVRLAGTARDAWGEALGRSRLWSFWTVQPEVVNESPASGANFASPRSSVRVTFNQPMDPASTARAFSLRTGGSAVPGSIGWQGYTLVFHPRQPLDSSKAYRVTVAPAARSVRGQGTLGRRVAWQFHAAPPPRVVEVDANPSIPSNGPQLQIHFSAPMSQPSLDRHLSISPPLSHLSTSFYGPDEAQTFTYTIFGDFQPSTRYTVSLAPGVHDQFGRPLPGAFSHHFTTDAISPEIALYGMPGAGEGIAFSAGQAMDAPIQLINVKKVSYTLIRTSLKAVAAMERTSPTSPPAGKTVRSWTEQVAHPLNKVQNQNVHLALADGSPLSPGLYWLSAETADGEAASSELVVVTNVGVTLKRASNGILAWVTSAQTGDGAPNVPVKIVSDQGKTLATAATDARGVARLHRPFFNAGNVNAVVDSGGLYGLARNYWQPAVSALDLGIPPWERVGGPNNGSYLYTDRPVYRPGQRVHFRAVLWHDGDGVYSLPGNKTATAIANDAQGRPIYRASLRLDRFGAVHGDFTLPRSTLTGYDWMSVSIPNTGIAANLSFQVAEYRKPEFLTAVTADRSSYVQGQTMTATVRVRYVFGAPVAHQQVTWQAYAQPLIPELPGWDQYTFFDWQTYWQQLMQPQPQSQLGGTIAQGQGTTDAQGRLLVHLPVNLAKAPIDETITLEATATDASHMPVSGRVQVSAYKAGFFVGLAPDRQTVPVGEQEKIAVVALTPDAKPLANQALVARIYRRTYTTQLNAQGSGWSSWQSVPHDMLVATQSLTTDGQGRASVDFTPQQGGEYYIAVQGKDARGNVAQSTVSIWASAAGFSQWGLADSTEITVKPDKASYRVGDTAHLLVGSPFPHATALVTVERGTIRSVRVVHLDAATSTVDLPITLDDLPNVYVTVTLYHGWQGTSAPDWRYGVADLNVQVDPRHLTVRLAQNGGRHRPGDPVTYTVITTDARGHAVSAQLSLALVDTAVLALQAEANPDILQAFYSPRPLGVSTASDGVLAIDHLKDRPNFPVQPVFGGGVTAGGGGGCGVGCLNAPGFGPVQSAAPVPRAPAKSGGGSAPPGLTVRSHFRDTAYWSATVTTNASGRATVHLKLPDNATTWRLDARAIGPDASVGQAALRTLATQDLVLQPVAPRFLVEGDRLRLGAIVTNNLSRPVAARVFLSAAGLRLPGAAPATINVPGHGARIVLWKAQVLVAHRVRLTVWVAPTAAGVRGDAVRITLPVHPPLTDETVATAGQVFAGIKQDVVVPRDAVQQPGDLTVQVSPSITAGMSAALADFAPSKWESNEDLADRVLAASSLLSLPPSLAGATRTHLRALITSGVTRLLHHQLGDGGWPWFNGPLAQSDPAITADAVQALTAAGRRGLAVQRGRSFLHAALTGTGLPDEERAHLLLVLALSGKAPHHLAEKLYGNTVRRAHLPPAALADLAWTLALSGDRAAAHTLIAELDGQAVVSATGAHWENSSWNLFAGPPIATTTRVLAALLAVAPRDSLVPAAARWLMLARSGSGWDCPPDSAQAMLALAAYARAAGEGQADYSYRLRVARARQVAGHFTGAGRPMTVRVGVSSLGVGRRSSVLLDRVPRGGSFGPGPLYYVARLRYFLPASHIAARSEGIGVQRRYLDAQGRPISSAPAGAVVKVQLTLHAPASLLYLRVDDPLPSGLEPIDQSLQTSQQGLFKPSWWFFGRQPDLSWFLDHVDLRDDRVSLYARYLPPGTYHYTYLAVATVPGSYGVSPTHAAESFFPEVFGRSKGQSFVVR